MESSERNNFDIRLKEYETLRAEVLMRAKTRFELVAAVIALAAVVATLAGLDEPNWWMVGITIGIGLVAIVAIWLWLGRAIRLCAGVLSEIEHAVNEEVGGLRVLTWEQRQQLLRQRGWWERARTTSMPPLP